MRFFAARTCGGIVIALLLVGCFHDDITGNDQIVGSGRLVTETRIVGTFTGILVANAATVSITQDSVDAVRVEADDNILDHVVTSVHDGVLVVGLKAGSYQNTTVRLNVSMKAITSLGSQGAAQFTTTGPIHADEIVCKIAGAGSIRLSGTTTRESVDITGAGDVRNFGLVSSQCTARIAGTGTVEVTATNRLDAVITGTGSIVYGGTPPVVQQAVTGIGSVLPRP